MSTVDEGHFRKLSKLKVLYITEACLFFNVNSNWVPPFPLDHFSMSSMKIDISMFGISGKGSSWFWNWTSNITFINLSNNHIECDISNVISFIYSNIYAENVWLVPKGNEMEYKENLKLVRLIDLSSNNLYGSILAEISDLSELRFLSLS
ncbi:receptor-like protein 11 [Quercus suber]|uniref:Receptor-like protein 11 n=1 Tax=Quercus suber TaxID=58331 RepID=A0AAW0KV17_QUESU